MLVNIMEKFKAGKGKWETLVAEGLQFYTESPEKV